MRIIFSFNNQDLSAVFKLIKVEHQIGNNREITTDSAPSIGVAVQEVNFGAKVIKLKVSLATRDLADQVFVDPNETAPVSRDDFYLVRERAAKLLHVDQPARLVLPNEPDRYYMAMPRGEIDLAGISDWYDQATVEFFIPDGVAHSTTYKRIDSERQAKVSGNKMVFDVTNNGSVPAQPIITIKHNAENGYLGMVNVSGVLELGNRREQDTQNYKQSETLIDYASNGQITRGFDQGKKNQAILNDNTQNQRGRLVIDTVWGRPHISLADRGGTSGNNGAGISWTIPIDSSGQGPTLNEYIWWRQIFWLGSSQQLGVLKICVSDEAGRFLYGVETMKRYYGLECEYNFMASDGKGGYNILKSWRFQATHMDSENPFNEPRGWSDLMRRDDMVQVYWFGSYPQFHIPEIKGRKSAKISVFFGALGSSALPTHMYLDQLIYRKDFVTGVRDIPNRYRAGSQVVLNSEVDTVQVDGIAKNSDVVQGSTWLTIPPGRSTLELYTSPWCKQRPTVTLNYEERWL